LRWTLGRVDTSRPVPAALAASKDSDLARKLGVRITVSVTLARPTSQKVFASGPKSSRGLRRLRGLLMNKTAATNVNARVPIPTSSAVIAAVLNPASSAVTRALTMSATNAIPIVTSMARAATLRRSLAGLR
jgi:hypothetical protein